MAHVATSCLHCPSQPVLKSFKTKPSQFQMPLCFAVLIGGLNPSSVTNSSTLCVAAQELVAGSSAEDPQQDDGED
eukprot:6488245-Amphidinium_carterae.3